MTGYVASGWMLVEEGKIVAIRLQRHFRKVEYKDIPGILAAVATDPVMAETGWEIGFRCLDCCGTGESVTDVRGNLVDCECPKCCGGIRWEREY